ncbi:MAG: DedA family protein [Planctomycetota bacterium]|jgi:membrane protein DedA with SNARE-associated domain
MLAETADAGVISYLWEFVQVHPDPILFGILVLCGVGLPMPEEPILLMAGAIVVELTHGGQAEVGQHLTRITLVCSAGILVGDLLCFHLGRSLGHGIFRWNFVNRIATRPRRVRAERFFQKYGAWSIFLARFFAGLRLVTYFSAGMSRRVTYWTFLLMDFLGTLVSVPISIYIGYAVWKELQDWAEAKDRLGSFHVFLVAAIAVGLLVWWLIYRAGRKSEADRRRRDLAALKATIAEERAARAREES